MTVTRDGGRNRVSRRPRGPRRPRSHTALWRSRSPVWRTSAGSTTSSPSRRLAEHVVHPRADHHVLPQRHGPVLVDDDRGVAAHGDQPVAELLGVADRGREADQRDVLGELQDHLLPHGAAEPVGEVVHLVHHDEAEVGQLPAARVDHVAQHLGGHDHHLRVAVDGGVAGEQPDGGLPVPLDEVGVLLVGQRLDRRRVEALAALGQREVHRELADHRLARAGRCADEHAVPAFQRRARPELEVVELERQQRGELGQLGVQRRDCGRRRRPRPERRRVLRATPPG